MDPTFGLGCLPQPISYRRAPGVGLGRYAGQAIPPSQYRSTSHMRRYVPRGKCQGSVPACCAYATLKIWQAKYAAATGKPYPELSYCALYQEATGGNFGEGTMPVDLIRRTARAGCFPVTPGLPEWFDSPRRVPADAAAARHLYLSDEWQECHTRGDVISAILNNDLVNVCIDWCEGDRDPGPSGHLSMDAGRAVGGHSLVGCGVVMGYPESPSGIGILLGNHHGDSQTPASRDERGNALRFPVWGDDGFGVVPIERVEADAEKYGSFALRTVMLRDSDLSDLPTPLFPAAA